MASTSTSCRSGTATINNLDFEGGKEYTLFVATRKINPYVYSELYTKEISTNLPYTEMVTLEKVGLTSITYHVEVPEGKEMKHIIVKKVRWRRSGAVIAA